MNAQFLLDRDRIRIADAILVYLERTPGSPGVVPPGHVPRPYGALPLAIRTPSSPAPGGDVEDTSGDTADDDDASPAGSKRMTSGAVVVAPAMPGEAIWLGFQVIVPASPVNVRVRIDEPRQTDAITGEPWADGILAHPRNFLTCPPETSLVGRPVTGGRRLFGGDTGEPLTVFVWRAAPIGVSVKFVTPAEFARISGREVDPLDPAAGYTERRLP